MSPRTRASVNRERRGNVVNPMFRLVRAAVRHADAIEVAEGKEGPDWHEQFMATGEELGEAALAYARSLSPIDRARIGKP